MTDASIPNNEIKQIIDDIKLYNLKKLTEKDIKPEKFIEINQKISETLIPLINNTPLTSKDTEKLLKLFTTLKEHYNGTLDRATQAISKKAQSVFLLPSTQRGIHVKESFIDESKKKLASLEKELHSLDAAVKKFEQDTQGKIYTSLQAAEKALTSHPHQNFSIWKDPKNHQSHILTKIDENQYRELAVSDNQLLRTFNDFSRTPGNFTFTTHFLQFDDVQEIQSFLNRSGLSIGKYIIQQKPDGRQSLIIKTRNENQQGLPISAFTRIDLNENESIANVIKHYLPQGELTPPDVIYAKLSHPSTKVTTPLYSNATMVLKELMASSVGHHHAIVSKKEEGMKKFHLDPSLKFVIWPEQQDNHSNLMICFRDQNHYGVIPLHTEDESPENIMLALKEILYSSSEEGMGFHPLKKYVGQLHPIPTLESLILPEINTHKINDEFAFLSELRHGSLKQGDYRIWTDLNGTHVGMVMYDKAREEEHLFQPAKYIHVFKPKGVPTEQVVANLAKGLQAILQMNEENPDRSASVAHAEQQFLSLYPNMKETCFINHSRGFFTGKYLDIFKLSLKDHFKNKPPYEYLVAREGQYIDIALHIDNLGEEGAQEVRYVRLGEEGSLTEEELNNYSHHFDLLIDRATQPDPQELQKFRTMMINFKRPLSGPQDIIDQLRRQNFKVTITQNEKEARLQLNRATRQDICLWSDAPPKINVSYRESEHAYNIKSFIPYQHLTTDLSSLITSRPADMIQRDFRIEDYCDHFETFIPPVNQQIRDVIRASFKTDQTHLTLMGSRGEDLLISSTEASKFKLGTVVNFSKNEKLGAGSFGTVTKVTNLVTQEKLAYKEAHQYFQTSEKRLIEFNLRSLMSLETEYNILRDIHKNGIVEGIQKPPRLLIDKNGSKGYLAPLYKTNMFEETDQLDFKTNFKRLFNGMSYLIQAGLVHGDIKPGNILVRNGFCDLADFGDVHSINDLKIGVRTYLAGINGMLGQDATLMKELIKKIKVLTNSPTDLIKREGLMLKWRDLQVKSMIWLLGITIGAGLGLSTVKISQQIFNISNESPLIQGQINQTLLRMMNPDPAQRITLEELKAFSDSL